MDVDASVSPEGEKNKLIMEKNNQIESNTGATAGDSNFPGQVHQLPGGGIVISSFNDIVNWARSNSLWPLTFATSCCGIEMMSVASSKRASTFRSRSLAAAVPFAPGRRATTAG